MSQLKWAERTFSGLLMAPLWLRFIRFAIHEALIRKLEIYYVFFLLTKCTKTIILFCRIYYLLLHVVIQAFVKILHWYLLKILHSDSFATFLFKFIYFYSSLICLLLMESIRFDRNANVRNRFNFAMNEFVYDIPQHWMFN